MPSVIPYDPSIALGNIVDDKKLERLEQIAKLQAPIDAAEEQMNSLIALKRSIDMTAQELINLRIDTSEISQESAEIGKEIKQAAIDYAKIKIESKKQIQQLNAQPTVSHNWESPLDYNRTEIKKMPLSADSMNMNVQYFSSDENDQNSKTQSESIQRFISSEFSFLGSGMSEQASKAAASQVNSQYSRHNIAGTLVIAVSCTHKDAVLLAPCVLDVDKAIHIWNAMYKDDMLKTDDPANMISTIANGSTENEKAMSIVSGATYGSCFVGMVHILNTSKTVSTEKMNSMANKIQAQIKFKKSIINAMGGFGSSGQFASDIKNLLSTQEISTHCNITTRGSIPSIKANNIKMAVKEFSEFDGKAAMEKLAALQNATTSERDSLDSSAEKARVGDQMIALHNSQIQGVLTGLKDIDDGENRVLDTNSMMTALEDYINKALAGELGMPINYYLKPITKSQLAQMWVNKYFPNQFLKTQTDEGEEAAG